MLIALGLLVRPAAEPAVAAEALAPAAVAEAVSAALFEAQTRLLTGDAAGAAAKTLEAEQVAAPLVAAFAPVPEDQAALTEALAAARQATAREDGAALAAARGRARTAMLRGSFALTLEATQSGDAGAAQQWLLLREFRPATRFARPNADGTLALKRLATGALDPAAAVQAVRADLLDTYQAKLDEALDAVAGAASQGYSLKLAEAGALAQGYWQILSPAYAGQAGEQARASADALFAEIARATLANDSGRIPSLLDQARQLNASFRAAPLSLEEQQRRAGQLLLYLSLVPVEYGRGVKDGAVLVPIEVQEARTFFDGAEAAFRDLRSTLQSRDLAATERVSGLLAQLDQVLAGTQAGTQVANPEQVASLASETALALRDLFPREWLQRSGAADFDVIRTLLDQMERAAAGRQFKQAESARLEAYAIFDAGPEKRLLGFSPRLAQRIERLFWGGEGAYEGLADALARGTSGNELRKTRLALDDALSQAESLLGSGKPATGAIIFNAATIVFREGLEAVLILASLLASMVGAHRHLKRPLVFGALAALGASGMLFVLARSVLLSLARYSEKIEAVVSLLAIGVLLLVMNWFFHKVYWTRWIAQHHARRRALIGGAAGQMLGLATLGFTSVFREGAETVLFLQALVLDAGTATVIEGTALGLLGVAAVGALTFFAQAKLPHKKMLIVTGLLIAAVLVTMVGNTMHALQAVGWAPVTPLGEIAVPTWANVWLGIHATWEGVVAQVAAIGFVLGSYVVAEQRQARSRQARLARTAVAAQD
jgi:high-affinity iron transporter